MCDTILAPPSASADRLMLFGKNSDRQRNEAQAIELLSAQTHPDGAVLRTTYLTIPQVRRTHAVLLSRPYWMWGAEIGVNEHGVAIGNEGLQARRPAAQDAALLGMDLIRLGLERADSAAAAIDVIVELLERHGQGGNCGHLQPSYYHNGFIVADPAEAFVLETVDREWVVERVTGVRTISNVYSIGVGSSARSAGLSELVRALGWDGRGEPSFAALLLDPERSHIGSSTRRAARTAALLCADAPRLRTDDLMAALRDHGTTRLRADGTPTDPDDVPVCVHAGAEPRVAHTAASLVAELRTPGPVSWVTATSTPCLGVFKPALFDAPLPGQGPPLSGRFEPQARWWQHERLNRTVVLDDLPAFVARISAERDELEAQFRLRVAAVLQGGSAADRASVVAECWADADALERRWWEDARRSTVRDPMTRAAWADSNDLARLPVG